MKALKFILSGKTAFFKVPMVNSVCYFTYGNIHKPALLGMFGAILGYKGYGYEITDFPEYYEKGTGKRKKAPQSRRRPASARPARRRG